MQIIFLQKQLSESNVLVFTLGVSDFAPASSKEFLGIQATMERGFTLKRVRDMTRTYSYTNAYLKPHLCICIHVKVRLLTFRIPNPKNSRVI